MFVSGAGRGWWFSWEEFGWEAEGEVTFFEAVGVVAAQGGEGPEDFGERAELFGFVDGASLQVMSHE